jgi:acetyltransferase-like isoleucine patch superfamily enzyme
MRDKIQSPVKLKVNNQMVTLGDGAIIEDSAVIGYTPSRGENMMLTIGPGAHIRSGTIIYGGSSIGCNLETGHNVVIREENSIGDDLRIWNNSTIDYGCHIGNNVRIHNKVYVAQFTFIEDDVFLAPGVTLANDIHPGCPDALKCMRGPHIKRGAQIGVNVCILPRVIIGEYAVIGAGSVVTKDIPDRVVAYGNPARVAGRIEDMICTTGLREKPYDYLTKRSAEDAYTIG